jgi:hypothetical protein
MRTLLKNVFLLSFLSLLGCEQTSDPVLVLSDLYFVQYEVRGDSGRVVINIKNENGSLIEFEDEIIPWNYSFNRLMPRGSQLFLSAKNPGGNSRRIQTTIYSRGDVFKANESTGPFITVIVQGTL